MTASRIAYLDYARGFAVFTMFLQHCMLVHEYTKGESSLLGITFVLLGTAPAAPVFLLLMGVFQARSRASVRQMLKRGLILIGLGYLLNFLRFSLPLWLVDETGFPRGESPLENLFAVDILHVAGLSFIICALLKQHVPKIGWLILAVATLLTAPYLWQSEPLWSPFNLLWGADPQIAFPLFPWLFYPIIGMLLSDALSSGQLFQKNLKFHLSILSGLLLLAVLLILLTPSGDYVRSGAGVHIGILAFIYVWFWLLSHLQHTSFQHSVTAELLCDWSHHVTSIYFIQWILFGWSVLLLGANDFPDFAAAIIGLSVLIKTHFLTRFERVRTLFP